MATKLSPLSRMAAPGSSSSKGQSVRYRFGPFTLDLERMSLLRDGVPVPLTPKVYDVLVALVLNHGRVVGKDELMQLVWPDHFVEEANLAQNISVLRKALGDGNRDARFIETLPKRGYRFVAPVFESAEGGESGPTRDPRRVSGGWVWIVAIAVLTGLFAVILSWTSRRSRPTVDPAYRTRPFAVDLPAQMYPAWSPDGRMIAFVGESQGTRTLWVKGLQHSNAMPISREGLQLTPRQFPFWSPDSGFIYFFASEGSTAIALYRISARGGEAAVIQESTSAATISPDGKTLVTLSLDDSKWSINTATPPDGPRQRYRPEPFSAADYFQRPTLKFAPDGRSILAAMNLPAVGPRYWLLPWPQGAPIRILEGLPFGVIPNFDWMPDSRHLVFLAQRRQELFLADTTTGKYEAEARVDRWPAYPSLSPDGTRMAYEAGLSHTDVIAVPLDGGPVEAVLGSSASEEMPACSPTSDQLVYVTDRRGLPELFLHLGNQADRPLFLSPEIYGARIAPTSAAPSFSPDGSLVAFRGALRASMSGILIAPVTGDTPARVVAQAPAQFAPTWSPDGKWLAFVQLNDGRYHLMKARTDGVGGPVDLLATMTSAGMTMILPEWSPAGDWVACGDVGNQLVLVRPDGSAVRKIGESGPVAWSRDGKTLFQVRYRDRSLVAIDVNSGNHAVLRQLGDLMPYATREPARRLTSTRDATRVVYSVLRPREEIWILEGLRPAIPSLARLWPW